MNKINVLYQNLNFRSGLYKNLETPLFASDDNLTDLLGKASISNYDSLHKDVKKTSSTKVKGSFQKHPRYIDDNSLVSVNEFPNDFNSEASKIDNIIRKVSYKRHVRLDASEETLINPLPPYKVINTNVPKIKEIDITEEFLNEKISTMNKSLPKQVTQAAHEEFLGVKLKGYLIKICAWMQEIRSTIQQGITPVEGAEDYFKREKRANEFSSRFSRNYVYQLGRQLIELRRSIHRSALNSSRSGAPSSARSLTNACQTVLQAVQAYCNHIPTTVYMPSDNSVHVKFSELLKDVGDLCRIIRKLSCTYYDVNTCSSIVEDIESNSKTLLSVVQDTLIKHSDPEPIKPIPAIKKPSMKKGAKGSNNKNGYDIPFHKRNPLENRLSMYSVSFKKEKKGTPNFKKSSELSRQRLYNIQKPKTVDTKTVQILNKSPVPEKKLERKIQIIQQSPSNSHISFEPVTINEDEIPTMVQSDRKELQTIGIRSRLEPLLKTLVAEVSAGKKEDLLGQGVCEDMLLKLKDLLDQVQRPIQNPSPRMIEMGDSKSKNYIQVTGAKNAKLFCIKDKSLFESKTETETSTIKSKDVPQHKSLSHLPNLGRNQSRKKLSQSHSQMIANLPKQYTINVIQYKIDFHKYTKPLLMYKKSSQVLPWILTGKITDSLFDNLLISVIDEININGLADKMYRAEFETF